MEVAGRRNSNSYRFGLRPCTLRQLGHGVRNATGVCKAHVNERLEKRAQEDICWANLVRDPLNLHLVIREEATQLGCADFPDEQVWGQLDVGLGPHNHPIGACGASLFVLVDGQMLWIGHAGALDVEPHLSPVPCRIMLPGDEHTSHLVLITLEKPQQIIFQELHNGFFEVGIFQALKRQGAHILLVVLEVQTGLPSPTLKRSWNQRCSGCRAFDGMMEVVKGISLAADWVRAETGSYRQVQRLVRGAEVVHHSLSGLESAIPHNEVGEYDLKAIAVKLRSAPHPTTCLPCSLAGCCSHHMPGTRSASVAPDRQPPLART